MINIEKLISPLIESQFPTFYREEGPQFIAFVKAYYEWMEQPGNPLYQSRRLTDYRDIDTTLDEFIVHFKEKYLRNIQFDTATNKTLLVKNSLDLYRSKGTERSIDLFFKLVYGTDAEVKYPADNLFRLSDGTWEVPLYLEITNSKYNVDYVGKQVIGSKSGATAFVEKYIRRRTDDGYVNILYVSNIVGNFINSEVIGINVNNIPTYDTLKRAVLVGSVSRVEVEQRGEDFKVGDIVTFAESAAGTGGKARVANTADSSGIVDFLFVDGGWGYTNTSSVSIVSDRVVSLNDVNVDATSNKYFNLFENLVQPLVNVAFSSSTDTNMKVGADVYRYAADVLLGHDVLVGQGTIIDITQTGATGTALISHKSGTFTNSYAYYTASNTNSFYVNSVQNKTVAGKVMGLPTTTVLSISNKNGTFIPGQNVYQQNTSSITSHGIITAVTKNTLTVNSISGAFKKTSSDGYLFVENNPAVYSNVEQINLTAGIYDINNLVATITYVSANNSTILNSPYVYQYSTNNKVTAKGLVIATTYSAGSGNLSVIPLYGNFSSLKKIYTSSNTAKALINYITVNVLGSDYNASQFARAFTQTTNTSAILYSKSFGAGAGFSVGNIGDIESVFINTDLVGSNNIATLDYGRRILNVSSATGFDIADPVYQIVNRTSFNASSSVNAISGFISIPSANTLFKIHDTIKYEVAAGNTALNDMNSGDSYFVVDANTSGLTLSYPYRKLFTLNTTNYVDFANNKVNETGHYFYKTVYGTVFSTGSGVLNVQDVYNSFGNSVGANSNVMLYSNPLVNTAITSVATYATQSQYSQPYQGLSIRAAAFGFPKNVQSDINEIIYNCFNFDRFEIGMIGNITNINPGSQYNADPYVIVQQPYISAQNRKDFIINIKDATSSYSVGELVKQNDVTTTYYDLKVNKGVYSNTYLQVIENVNSQTDVNDSSDFISVVGNQYSNNTMMLYKVPTNNTAISGLIDNTAYYAVYANTSGFAVSTTYGGSNINLTAATAPETHTFSTIPGYLPGNKVYQGSANAYIESVYLDGSNQYVRISSNTAAFATNQILYSYSNPYVNGTVSAITSGSMITSAKGIVKAGSNTSVLKVKRLTYRNQFVVDKQLTGASSGATSNIQGVIIDQSVMYPIGLNAVVEANVVTANGQVTSLQVIDSGVGYTNSQVIQFLSSDLKRAGQMKLILDGNGKSEGYYRSSKGFISDDMYIHDGDYYQEYSYEILSKLSFEKYSDMFKKVMHVAGTKFFGSVSVTEEAAIPVTVSEIATGSEMSFDSKTQANGANERITLSYNPFANGDLVYYYVAAGNTVVTGLTNAHSYYVVNTIGNSIQLALTSTGSAINITSAASSEVGHYLSKYVEESY